MLDKKTKLPPKGTKDAIHVATFVVSSKHILFPGDSVKFLDVGTNQVEKCERIDPMMIGIVNPFGSMVMANTAFEVFVTPSTVTKLRHSWDFPEALVPKDSEDQDDDDDGEYQSSDWGDECKGC